MILHRSVPFEAFCHDSSCCCRPRPAAPAPAIVCCLVLWMQISGACVICGLYSEGALVLANVGDCQAVYHGQVKSAPGSPVTAQTVSLFATLPSWYCTHSPEKYTEYYTAVQVVFPLFRAFVSMALSNDGASCRSVESNGFHLWLLEMTPIRQASCTFGTILWRRFPLSLAYIFRFSRIIIVPGRTVKVALRPLFHSPRCAAPTAIDNACPPAAFLSLWSRSTS